jgi:hypothetical protein
VEEATGDGKKNRHVFSWKWGWLTQIKTSTTPTLDELKADDATIIKAHQLLKE